MQIVGKSVFRTLYTPAKRSRKGQNGVLFVVGGSEKYHGAPLLAAKAASKIVDLVYFHSPAQLNHEILAKIKGESDCFIAIPAEEVFAVAEKSDCIWWATGWK